MHQSHRADRCRLFPKLNFTNNEHFCVCEGGNVMDLRLQLATHYSSFIDKT